MRPCLLPERCLSRALVELPCVPSLAAPSTSLLALALTRALTVNFAVAVALPQSAFVCRKPRS